MRNATDLLLVSTVRREGKGNNFFLAAFIFLFLLFSLQAQAGSPNTISPAEELKTFTVPDGFEVNLYASEDLGILNPMQMRWDADGRLYVISSLGYPHLRPGEQPKDKIIVLSDTNDDGVADKSTVFAEALNIPTGLEPGHGGLYVGEQSHLVFLKDTDGDGIADHREVVLSGFGVGDTHQAINSFVWSPGGELYMDQGDGIESRVETPWGLSGLYQAGVMRFRPKRMRLDPFLDDFMGPGNPWGIAFDDWGQAFVIDGAGGISFLSPAMMPVRRKRNLRRIGKPGGYCGVDILGTEHFPAEFQGDHIIGDFKNNRIGRYATIPSGAGFRVEWKEPLLVSSHQNFRPVDVRIGPDGAVYVCDWYNSIICHQDDPFRHPDRDVTHGRIWRVSYKDKTPIRRPALKSASNSRLIEHLASKERWIRYHAKTVLANRDSEAVGRAVAEYCRANPLSDHHLFEIVGALESVEHVDARLLGRLASVKDYRGRAYAARVIGRWHDRLREPLSLLRPLAMDLHPQVRMEAVVAAAHIPVAESVEIAAAVADHEIDYDIDYALSQAVHHLRDHWVPAFQKGELAFAGKTNRLLAVLERLDSNEMVDSLRRIARNELLQESKRVSALKSLARIGADDDIRFVVHAATRTSKTAEIVRELLNRPGKVAVDADFSTFVELLLLHSDIEVQRLAIELAGKWKTVEAQQPILAIAKSTENWRLREAAIRALGSLGGDESTSLLGRLSADTDLEVSVAAIGSWCRLDPQRAAKFAAKLLSSESLSESHIENLIRGMSSRKNGLDELATALSRVELTPTVAQQLLNSLNAMGQTESRLVDRLIDTARLQPSLPEFSPERVAEIAARIDTGDPHRGKALFRSKTVNCVSCHSVNEQGGKIGPDLTTVGTTLPKDRLVQEVLWPQQQVKEGYDLQQVVTVDGELVQGYRRKSRNKKRVLLQPLDSEMAIEIDKDDIEEIQDVGSPMPENIVAVLSEQERLDLLAYLRGLGRNSN